MSGRGVMEHAPKDGGAPAGEEQQQGGEQKAVQSRRETAMGCGFAFCLVALAVVVTVMVTGGGRERQQAHVAEEPPPPLAWYEGGTLHKASDAEWRAASRDDRLATSADWTVYLVSEELVDELRSQDRWRNSAAATAAIKSGSMNAEDVRIVAVNLMTCVDEAVAEPVNTTVNQVASLCWVFLTAEE